MPKLLFLAVVLLLDVKKLILHEKYAAKAQISKNLVYLLLHKTLWDDPQSLTKDQFFTELHKKMKNKIKVQDQLIL